MDLVPLVIFEYDYIDWDRSAIVHIGEVGGIDRVDPDY